MIVCLKQIRRVLTTSILALALWAVLLPAPAHAIEAPQPCVAPPGPTNLAPAPGPSTEASPQFSWDQVPEALWYQIWITKDGATFKSAWLYNNTYWYPPERLASGTYRWWVRAWNPCGTGQWVSGGAYVLTCPPLAKPVPSVPSGDTYSDYAQNLEVDFGWPSSYASWAQFNISRNGKTFFNQWIKLPYTSSYQYYYDFGYGFFTSGDYEWTLREWAPCGGTSEWSDPLSFTVNANPCTGAPAPASITGTSVEFYPLNGMAGSQSSVRPWVYWNFLSEVVWYQVQVLADGQVYLTDWVQRNGAWQPKGDLPAGNLGVRVRGWNECGFGPWSPTEALTLGCETGGQVTGLDEFRCDYGYGLAVGFDALPGVSWYQVIVRKNGLGVFNEWLELGRDYDMIEAPYGQGRVEVQTYAPCSEGDYEAYVRAWSRPCGTTPWAGPIALTPDCSLGVAEPIKPSGDSSQVQPEFLWAEAAGAMGYELVLQRNGKPYHRTQSDYFSKPCGWTESMDIRSFDVTSGVPQGWRADDQAWELELPFYFPFCGNSYDRCWVGSNGTISFGSAYNPTTESQAGLASNVMIAALWDDLETDTNPGDDIYITTGDTSVTIRWQGTHFPDTGTVNFSATLYANGAVRLSYGTGNTQADNLSGISRGNGTDYLLSAESNTSRTNADDILFLPLRSWSPFFHLPIGDYQWWVRAMGVCDDGATWSPEGSFSIVPTI